MSINVYFQLNGCKNYFSLLSKEMKIVDVIFFVQLHLKKIKWNDYRNFFSNQYKITLLFTVKFHSYCIVKFLFKTKSKKDHLLYRITNNKFRLNTEI